MTPAYRAAQIFAWIGIPWTLLVALVVSALVNPRVPPWDRAAIYSMVSGLAWTLIAVPFMSFVGTLIAARAIRQGNAQGWWALGTVVANALVALTYLLLWLMLLVPSKR